MILAVPGLLVCELNLCDVCSDVLYLQTHLISSHHIPGAQTTAVGVLRDILQKDGWRGLFRGEWCQVLFAGYALMMTI